MKSNKRCIVLIDSGILDNEYYSHIELCEQLLIQCTNNEIDIITLEIDKDSMEKANIYQLVDALEQCIELNPIFVSLSIGSIKLSDALIVKAIIDRLRNQNVMIVAAVNNQGYVTIPASLPSVIGVEANIESNLKIPQIYRARENERGVDLIVDYRELQMIPKEVKKLMVGNSFVVPVAIGFLIKYWKTGISKEELLNNISHKKEICVNPNLQLEILQIPYVRIKDVRFDKAEMEEGFCYLSNTYQLEGLMYTEYRNGEDLYFYTESIAAVDIIFSQGCIEWLEAPDITIERKHDETIYEYDGQIKRFFRRHSIKKILDILISIFSENMLDNSDILD